MIIGLTYDLRIDYLKSGYSQEDVAEFDSEETINALEETIRGLGYQTDRIGNIYALTARLAAGDKWDLVFNFAEGLYGRCRESQVPALLEAYRIGYTFSDPLVCDITLDKSFAKRIVRDAGLATPKFKVIETLEDVRDISLHYPLFAKPLAEGTGKGIDQNSQIESPDQLRQVCENLLKRYSQPVLVEEFLPGREFTAAILGNGQDARLLGIMEIIIPKDDKAIYSFDAKERCEELVKYRPCPPGALYRKIERLALDSFRVLQCRDTARVDIRCDAEGEPCFLEINPMPGLHPHHSDLPMIATQEGMSYRDLIGTIISNALKRLSLQTAAT